MIHEEIVTFEVAKLAKAKGFPQHIGNDAYVVENEYDDKYEVECHYPIQFIPDYLPTIAAPTQSLLQRWLREEKCLFANIVMAFNGYYYQVIRTDKFDECIGTQIIEHFNGNKFDTYEHALEDALKYALKNLV